MLAAPILNPVVVLLDVGRILRTEPAAHGGGARRARAWSLATVSGLLIARMGAGKLLARPEHVHNHAHGDGRVQRVMDTLSSDFFFMGKFVVAGAALAAAMQTLVPQDVFTGVLTTPLVGAALLMAFAFLLFAVLGGRRVRRDLVRPPVPAGRAVGVPGLRAGAGHQAHACSTRRPSAGHSCCGSPRSPSSLVRRRMASGSGAGGMKLDWLRLVRGAALLAWAGFFDWLWPSGRAGDLTWDRGPRSWSRSAASCSAVATVLYLRGARGRSLTRPDRGRRPAGPARASGAARPRRRGPVLLARRPRRRPQAV